MIQFSCSNCGRLMSAPYSAAGTLGQCPTCGTVGTVPLPVWNSQAANASAPSETFPRFDEEQPASAKAKARPSRLGTTGCGCLLVGSAISFLVLFAYIGSDSRQSGGRSKFPEISKTNECIIKRGTLASPSEELLDKAYRYVDEGDEEALLKLMSTGTVIELEVGLRAHFVKANLICTKIKIRPHGKTVELWTVIEAIKEKD